MNLTPRVRDAADLPNNKNALTALLREAENTNGLILWKQVLSSPNFQRENLDAIFDFYYQEDHYRLLSVLHAITDYATLATFMQRTPEDTRNSFFERPQLANETGLKFIVENQDLANAKRIQLKTRINSAALEFLEKGNIEKLRIALPHATPRTLKTVLRRSSSHDSHPMLKELVESFSAMIKERMIMEELLPDATQNQKPTKKGL